MRLVDHTHKYQNIDPQTPKKKKTLMLWKLSFNSKLTNVNLVVNSDLPMGRDASHMNLLKYFINKTSKYKQ